MKITHNLLPKQKARTHNLNVEIDVYPYAEELYTELERIGIIERIKQIPQLGVIRVKSKLAKTRYDYVILQLYLHQLIKQNLGEDLKLSYNNYVKASEFENDYKYLNKNYNQAVFLEAKNRNRQPVYAKKCLKEKFDKLSLNYMEENIAIVNCDAYMEYDI